VSLVRGGLGVMGVGERATRADVECVALFAANMLLSVADPTAIGRILLRRTRLPVAAQAPMDGSV
jgi:hypothetical protein